MSVVQGSASLSSGGGTASNGTSGINALTGGGGYSAYTDPQTINSSIGGLLDGKQYVNKISGNTLVDGNVYINGTLNYVASDSASTTVVGGVSGLPERSSPYPANVTTSSGTSIVNAGQSGYVADAHGKITAGTTTEATSAMVVTNGYGNTHGFIVSESSATMSGGTQSTSLTLNNGGAFFSNASTGAPVRVTGVADGTTDFDAVNYRQLREVKRGIAGVSAMSNIPAIQNGKTYAVSAGCGLF